MLLLSIIMIIDCDINFSKCLKCGSRATGSRVRFRTVAGGSRGEDSDRLLNSCKWYYSNHDITMM